MDITYSVTLKRSVNFTYRKFIGTDFLFLHANLFLSFCTLNIGDNLSLE
ncbi:hypothetical protein FORC066_4505 [Yersinia enterocolitica]|nr:hypothetical protein FORC066_4505 [Yersinia enterocolitica]